MRMLLVQPPQGTSFGLTRILTSEPLGLECVGGALRTRGHDASLIDLRVDSWESLERALDDPPRAVGITCAFTTDVLPVREVASFVKERWPELPVPVGEGEFTTIEFAEARERGQAPEGVPGILTLRNRGNGFRSRPFTRELDELPRADRSLSAPYRRWYHHGLQPRSASLETSRGCPFDCNFCSVWVFYDRRAGRRSPASLVREIETLEEQHVFFTDDIAFLNHDAYKELGERIAASGIEKMYACETRSDLVVRYRDLFRAWRRVGLTSIFLGVEKVDDAGLAEVRKRTKGGVNTNVEAIHILREEGIT